MAPKGMSFRITLLLHCSKALSFIDTSQHLSCVVQADSGSFVSIAAVRAAGKTGDKSKAKALKAAKAVKRSTWRQSRKPRYSTVFHRPKTFEAPRKPKFPRLRYRCTIVLGQTGQIWSMCCHMKESPGQSNDDTANRNLHICSRMIVMRKLL